MSTKTKTFIFLGLAASIVVAVFGIMSALNDGSKVLVNSIDVLSIQGDTSNRLVKVYYDKDRAYSKLPSGGHTSTPMGPGTFKIRNGDSIKLDSAGYLSGTSGNDKFVVRRSTDVGVIDLKIPITKLNNNLPNPTTPCSPEPPCYSDNSVSQGNTYTINLENRNVYMYIGTNWTNHAAGGISDLITTAIETGINIANDILDNPDLQDLLNGGKNIPKNTFCKMLPIFCDSTIWLVILIGIVAMIIFVAVS